MINFSTETKTGIGIIFIFILFVAFCIWGVIEREKETKKEFFECVEKVQDVEWYYDKFILD